MEIQSPLWGTTFFLLGLGWVCLVLLLNWRLRRHAREVYEWLELWTMSAPTLIKLMSFLYGGRFLRCPDASVRWVSGVMCVWFAAGLAWFFVPITLALL